MQQLDDKHAKMVKELTIKLIHFIEENLEVSDKYSSTNIALNVLELSLASIASVHFERDMRDLYLSELVKKLKIQFEVFDQEGD